MHWIVENRFSLAFFRPEILLIVLSMLFLVLGAWGKRIPRQLIGLAGVAGLFAYMGLSMKLLDQPLPPHFFAGMIALDEFSIFFKVFCGLVAVVTLLFVMQAREFKDVGIAEFVAFLAALTLGMSMMAASTDMIMMFLSLEMVSVLSYIMVGNKKHSRVSSEAGIKYLLYGAVSSGVMLFGFSYLFGLTGSTSLSDLALYFKNVEGISSAPVILFSLLCVMTGLGFKIATFPTQMWCPDVYEGAPTPVTAFLSVGPKAAGFAMALRFFYTAFDLHGGKGVPIFEFIHWNVLVAILAALTMTVGNLAAISQRNLKRLMAYSSIAHAGYLLMGLATLSMEGVQAILFYLVVYLFMNFGAFMVILAIGDRVGTEEIDGYRGLGWRSPVLAATLSIFLFSLAGLPPFAGFVGKFFLFSAVIKGGLYWLAVIAVLNSVISLFYYARILKAMYFEAPLSTTPISIPAAYTAFSMALAIPTLILGLFWEPILAFATQSAQSLF